jgi:hypothetical protein
MKGFYPSGVESSSDSFVPSGALIKAMLIHSANPLSYIVTSDSYGTQSAVPLLSNSTFSYVQGFGRIQLDNVLNFGTSTVSENVQLSLFVIGAASYKSKYYRVLTNGEKAEHIFYTTSDETQPTIKITLAYTDYPGASGSAQPLVNVS